MTTLQLGLSDSLNQVAGQPQLEEIAGAWNPRFSPDGTKIAYDAKGPDSHGHYFFVVNTEGDQLTGYKHSGYKHKDSPVWSYDGKKIAFLEETGSYGDSEINLLNLDTKEHTVIHTHEACYASHQCFSPDSNKIYFLEPVDRRYTMYGYLDGQFDVFVMDTDGSNLINLTDNPADNRYFRLSGNGTKIVLQDFQADFTCLQEQPGFVIEHFSVVPVLFQWICLRQSKKSRIWLSVFAPT